MYARAAIASGAAAVLLLLPFRAEARNNTFIPSVTLDFRYDSNVRFVDDEAVDEPGDYIASVMPGFKLSRRGSTYELDVHYGLTADFHARNPDLNNISHRAGVSATADLTSRWHVGAGDSFSYAEDSLRAIGFEEGVLVTRTDILTNNVYFSIGRETTKNTSASLTLRNYVQKFENPDLVDSRTDSGTLTGSYMYSPTGTASLSYTHSVYSFDTEREHIRTHGVMAGVEEAVSPTMSVNLAGGAEYATGLNGDDVFLTANAGVARNLKDSVLTLYFVRDVSTPTGLTDEISIRDSVVFIWDFTVTRDISSSIYAGLASHKSEPDEEVDIRSYIAEVSGNWQANRWIRLGAGVSHYRQWTEDGLGTGLRRNKIFVNITLSGGEWRF